MSNEAITWAFKQNLPTTDKFVLLSLADYADENMSCYPSHKKTADRIGASPATVKRAIGRLEEAGYINIEKRHRADGSLTSNRYRVNIDRAAPPAHSEPRVADEPTPGHSSAPTPDHNTDPRSGHSYDLAEPALIPQVSLSEPGAADADARIQAVPGADEKPWAAIATAAYDATDGALSYMGMYKIAEWAITKKERTPDEVNNAIQSLWRSSRAVNKQTVGQHLDGIARATRQAPAERVASTAAIGERLQAEADRRAVSA